ncbi:hypothetical protein ACVWW9_000822 [Agrococcus sp. UYP33]
MDFAEADDDTFHPPSLDEVSAEFPVRLATLVAQPGIREIGVNTIASSSDGGPFQLDAAAITYVILWNPDDLDDPVNHVVLPDEVEVAIAHRPVELTPAEAEWLRWMRFPTAYEAVQTVVPCDDESVADVLAQHMWGVIANTFRERHPAPHELDSFIDPPAAVDAVDGVILVDGEEVACVEIPDEHVRGLGVELDDAVALVVWPRHMLPLVRLELTRRPRPATGAASS